MISTVGCVLYEPLVLNFFCCLRCTCFPLLLHRFEWYEIIVRTAVSKYGGGRKTTDISDSVDMLIENNIKV